jgi:hypothetical protein
MKFGPTRKEVAYLRMSHEKPSYKWLMVLSLGAILATVLHFTIETKYPAEAHVELLSNEAYCEMYNRGEYVATYQVHEYCNGL